MQNILAALSLIMAFMGWFVLYHAPDATYLIFGSIIIVIATIALTGAVLLNKLESLVQERKSQ